MMKPPARWQCSPGLACAAVTAAPDQHESRGSRGCNQGCFLRALRETKKNKSKTKKQIKFKKNSESGYLLRMPTVSQAHPLFLSPGSSEALFILRNKHFSHLLFTVE